MTTVVSPVVSFLLCGAKSFLQHCLVGVLCKKEWQCWGQHCIQMEPGLLALSNPSFPSSRTKGLTIHPLDPGRLVIMLPSPALACHFSFHSLSFIECVLSSLATLCHLGNEAKMDGYVGSGSERGRERQGEERRTEDGHYFS